jgi:hypothetical protein
LLLEIPDGLFELVGLVEGSFGSLNDISAGFFVVLPIGKLVGFKVSLGFEIKSGILVGAGSSTI